MYRVHDYIATGLASRLVDPDGRHQQIVDKQQSTGSSSRWALPTDGWTTNLKELPKFSYGNIFAHLVSNSKTVASNQKSAATERYRKGAMKHKEAGYRLYKDDHVKRVKFHPGSDNQCFCCALVQASFKSSTNYSTSVCLHKSDGSVFGAQCKCKAGAGGCCKHVAALFYCILDYSDHQLTQIPDHRTCTDKPQQWNVAKEIADGGPILFSDIQIVHHTYGKRKAEDECNRIRKHKQYHACPTSLQAVTEEQIRVLCTNLESHQKNSPFSKLLRRNDCKPLTESTTVTVSEITNAISDPEQCTNKAHEDNTLLNSNDTILIDENISQSKCDMQSNTGAISSGEAHNNACNGSNNVTTLEEAVIECIRVTQEQAKKIEIETMEQSHSEAWFKECQWRITASYFGTVCKM